MLLLSFIWAGLRSFLFILEYLSTEDTVQPGAHLSLASKLLTLALLIDLFTGIAAFAYSSQGLVRFSPDLKKKKSYKFQKLPL